MDDLLILCVLSSYITLQYITLCWPEAPEVSKLPKIARKTTVCQHRIVKGISLTAFRVIAGQGTFYMDGHWYYQAIDTRLAVNKKNCDPELPLIMDPKRIFKASAADNEGWNSFQAVTAVDRCGRE
jgi:hypothetical protein